jgi:predicted ArsR family transcriptional regulator
MTARQLAADLGIGVVAVREQLARLQQLGLVRWNVPGSMDAAGRPVPKETLRQEREQWLLLRPARRPGRRPGRPSATWSLTDDARALFPDRHADLTVELLGAMRAALGDDALVRIVEVRARDQATLYRDRLPAGGSLRKRVEALAARRSDEGYMAEVVQEKPGSYLLIEHHCPICEAARTCQRLCAAELDVFRTVLGPDVRVERIEHLLADGARCVYRIEAA